MSSHDDRVKEFVDSLYSFLEEIGPPPEDGIYLDGTPEWHRIYKTLREENGFFRLYKTCSVEADPGIGFLLVDPLDPTDKAAKEFILAVVDYRKARDIKALMSPLLSALLGEGDTGSKTTIPMDVELFYKKEEHEEET
jgi:hypothetical protein